MAATQTHSGRRHVSPETLSRLKHMDAGRRHPGHAHFWDRALSRRRFLPSSIFDFDGDIGFAVVDGTGVGRDTTTGVETAYDYEVDLRFMQGKYIGKDGKHHHGTFCLI